ncbi:hypothetical protein IAT38_003095 [Cryptococcus sp. DSM 104549]
MDPSLALAAAGTPPLSSGAAHILSLLFTSSYVGSLYLSQTLFPPRPRPKRTPSNASSPATSGTLTPSSHPAEASRAGDQTLPPIAATDDDALGAEDPHAPKLGSRDHPLTIRRRMAAVSVSTALSLGGVRWAATPTPRGSWFTSLRPTLALLGLSAAPVRALPYLLAPGLMLGPLYAMYLDDALPVLGRREYGESLWKGVKRAWAECGLVEVRNYVVAPVTEELVFRSAILSVSILGGLSLKALVFGTPMWFGIAHAHHALETYRKNGKTKQAAIMAVAGCLVQLTYTTLFGWFASYLYLRTGSVLPPLTAHIYCNIMGIYMPGAAIRRHPRKKALVWGAYLAGIAAFVWGTIKL